MKLLAKLFAREEQTSPLLAEAEARKQRMEERRQEMFTQMMLDGTHLFAGKKYNPVLGKSPNA